MAASAGQSPRGCSTICLPFDKGLYPQLVDSPAQFREALDRFYRNMPELFPEDFGRGYTLKDSYVSTQLGLRLRRVACNPDYWHPVAQSRKLKRNKTLAVTFAGEPIALVRTDSGKVFALEDRCAHRQFPLSKGLVCGEEIQCGYHAWRYDAAGAITAIPYLVTGVRPPNRVRAYPCREAFGLIFVFPGDPALAEQTAFPELPWFDSRRATPTSTSRRAPRAAWVASPPTAC